jgi:dihydroneopterin aldolase
MDTIKLNNIRVYAHHGCLGEETKIGSEYRVDLAVKADLGKPAQTDKLEDTVDYVMLNRVVKAEMAVPSKLLESVAERILERVLKESTRVEKASVRVSKINPPLGGDVESVSVKMSKTRRN